MLKTKSFAGVNERFGRKRGENALIVLPDYNENVYLWQKHCQCQIDECERHQYLRGAACNGFGIV